MNLINISVQSLEYLREISINDNKNVSDLLVKNRYHLYTAASCKLTGLPMLDSSDYSKHSNTWLSASKCKSIKQPVKVNEQPVAFYRCKNGYCALYLRSNCTS